MLEPSESSSLMKSNYYKYNIVISDIIKPQIILNICSDSYHAFKLDLELLYCSMSLDLAICIFH